MLALVLPNGSEIEIYDAGSAVSPIDDGMYIWIAWQKRGRGSDREGRGTVELCLRGVRGEESSTRCALAKSPREKIGGCRTSERGRNDRSRQINTPDLFSNSVTFHFPRNLFVSAEGSVLSNVSNMRTRIRVSTRVRFILT